MDLQRHITDLIKKRCDLTRPILLGLSGGPDSLCLFHLLLATQKETDLNIHVAHVDHRWRQQSQQEAQQLSLLAAEHAVPFHLRILDPSSLVGNLEAACREERLRFFSELCVQHNCQAVLLGHHANDQAETVLKRLFESGSVLGLAALQEESLVGNLKIWRPLLPFSKEILEQWLKERSLIPFEDSTNLEHRFLRGRFRSQIIPELNRTFGKNIQDPLCRLGEEASELRNYFDKMTSAYMNTIIASPLGLYLDLQNERPLELVELRHLIKRFCLEGGLVLSYPQLQKAVEITRSGYSNCHFSKDRQSLYIDRRRLFIPQTEALRPLPTDRQPLQMGRTFFGNWVIDVESIAQPTSSKHTSWKTLWKGSCEAIVPYGDHYWTIPSPSNSYQGRKKTLGEWWTDHHVPAFFRCHVPVLMEKDHVHFEFLTGCSNAQNKEDRCPKAVVNITLTLKNENSDGDKKDKKF